MLNKILVRTLHWTDRLDIAASVASARRSSINKKTKPLKFKIIVIGITILFCGCSDKRNLTQNKLISKEMGRTIDLKIPDNSIEFFQDLKIKSEGYWNTIELNKGIYGFQTQKNTKWNKGLSEEDINTFESELGIKFSNGLRNYYKVMNGVDLPAINIYGSSGSEPKYSNNFYSYPKDLEAIKKQINWIYESNDITEGELIQKGISRIFPVFGHRFVLVDTDDELVLSMYGDDIIYWTDNISKLLAIEIFEGKELSKEFRENQENAEKVNFWLDYE